MTALSKQECAGSSYLPYLLCLLCLLCLLYLLCRLYQRRWAEPLAERILRGGPISFRRVHARVPVPSAVWLLQQGGSAALRGSSTPAWTCTRSLDASLARQLSEMWGLLGDPPVPRGGEAGAGAGRSVEPTSTSRRESCPDSIGALREFRRRKKSRRAPRAAKRDAGAARGRWQGYTRCGTAERHLRRTALSTESPDVFPVHGVCLGNATPYVKMMSATTARGRGKERSRSSGHLLKSRLTFKEQRITLRGKGQQAEVNLGGRRTRDTSRRARGLDAGLS